MGIFNEEISRYNFNNNKNNVETSKKIDIYSSNSIKNNEEENKYTLSSSSSTSALGVKYKSIDKMNTNDENNKINTIKTLDTEIEEIALTSLTKTNNQTHNASTNENVIQNNNTDVCRFVNENNKLAQPPSGQQNANTNFRGINSIASYIQPQIASDIYASTYQRPLYPVNNMPQQTNFAIHQIQKKKVSAHKIQMFRFLEIGLKRVLFHLAKATTQHKIFFQIFPIVLTCLPFTLNFFIRPNVSFDTPPFDSFLPDASTYINSIEMHNQLSATVAALSATGNNVFNNSNPVFDALKRSSSYEFSIIISSKKQFGNILSTKSLKLYKKLFDQIRNISILDLNWEDMCREDCGKRTVIDAILNRQLLLKYPEAVILKSVENNKNNITSNLNMNRIFLANILGDVELDSDGIILRAGSLLLNIKLKESLNYQTILLFEENLQKILANFSALLNTNLNDISLLINYWSFQNYITEVIDSFKNIHICLILSAVLFVIFVICGIGFYSCDSYKNRPFVALQIIFIIVFSIIVSYTIHIMGVSGTLNLALFPILFIFISITILMFSSVQQCFLRYSMAALHPTEKLAFIYSWDIPCFVSCAFAISISTASAAWFTDNSYLRQSLLIIATGIISVLILGVFYLTVTWYTAEKREASGLKWFHIFRKGDESFNNKQVIDYDELICDRLHEKLTDLKPNFSRWVGRIVINYNLRTISVVLFTAYLIFACFGYFSVERKLDLHEEDFIRQKYNENSAIEWKSSSNYLKKFKNAFGTYNNYLELIFDLPIDYFVKRNKEHIFELLRWPMDNGYATKAVSWLLDFERFQKSTVYDVNPDTIIPVINYVFLTNDAYKKYLPDIGFDRFETQILKSRMYLELNNKGISSSETLINELEKRAKVFNLPLTFKAPYSFLLRHNRQIFSIALSTFIFLIVFLTGLCIIFFTHLVICICVPLSCIFVSIGVCGLGHYFVIPLNIITLSAIICGNLLTASVTIYFCYMFCNSGNSQICSSKQMEYAFQCTLYPTFLACFSITFLFTPLLICNLPAIFYIWKVLAAISFLTFLNYLFVLPSLTIILNDYISMCTTSVDKFCDSIGCCPLEQTADGIYFVPSNNNLGMNGATSRSISYFNRDYLINNASILPPAYDCHNQQMLIGPVIPPLLPPPPPALPQQSIEYLSNCNNGKRKTERLQQYNQQNLDKQRLIDHCYIINETTDSNSNSLELQNATSSSNWRQANFNNENENETQSTPSSQHQTPRRNRRELINNKNVSSPHLSWTNNHRHINETEKIENRNRKKRIYEELELPPISHPQRSKNDLRQQNKIQTNNDFAKNQSIENNNENKSDDKIFKDKKKTIGSAERNESSWNKHLTNSNLSSRINQEKLPTISPPSTLAAVSRVVSQDTPSYIFSSPAQVNPAYIVSSPLLNHRKY